MSKYVLTDEARQDLADIRAYLRNEAGLRIALSVVRKIAAAFSFLSNTPGAGHSREDLTPEAVKFWPVFSYLIIYDPVLRPIQIIRVLHGQRELSALFQDDDSPPPQMPQS